MAGSRPGARSEKQTISDAPEALYLHCVDTYEAMLAEARTVVTYLGDGEESEEGTTIVVYEGFLTKLVTTKLHLSVPYFSSITGALKRMGCIQQLRRDGGSSPSQWQLLREPTEELFATAQPKKTRKMNKTEMLQDQVTSLNRRVGQLEEIVHQLIKGDGNG